MVISQVMSVVSYVQFMLDAYGKQRAVRAANGGQLPDLIDTAGLTSRLTALKKPQSSPASSQSSSSASPSLMVPVAPAALAPMPPSQPPVPTAFPYGATTVGTSSARMQSSGPSAHTGWGQTSHPGPVGEAFAPHAQHPNAQTNAVYEVERAPNAATSPPGGSTVVESGQPNLWTSCNPPVRGGRPLDVDSQPASEERKLTERVISGSDVPESADQIENHTTWRKRLSKLWESVREEPRIGFKCACSACHMPCSPRELLQLVV